MATPVITRCSCGSIAASASGLAFQAAYTWGHAISDVALTSFTNTTSDPFNFDSDKGDADLDRRHTFVSNVVYVLPSFRSWGKAAEFALGDWQVNAIASYFGATPLDITTGANTIGTASAVGQRPNYTGAPLVSAHWRFDATPEPGSFCQTGSRPARHLRQRCGARETDHQRRFFNGEELEIPRALWIPVPCRVLQHLKPCQLCWV